MSLPKTFFQKLMPSQLPFPLSEGKRYNGIYADLAQDGSVLALHVYRYGQHVHTLALDPDKLEVKSLAIKEFSYDSGLSFIDGWKNFDESLDHFDDTTIDTLPEPEYAHYVRYINYVAWVKGQAAALLDLKDPQDAINACSFCQKDRSQIAKLVAGPNVSICNECADLAHEVVHMAEIP